jgi:hypothetical protein
MPRIGSNLLDCALYLYRSKQDARIGDATGGSGFLFPLSYSEDCSVEGIHVYAVTNAHLVCQRSFPVIRLRRRDGEIVIIDTEEAGGKWILHPNGDDLAACLLHLEDTDAFRLITPPWHKRPRPEAPGIDEYGEILGRDVVMVGRFIGHGKETNIPTLRFGNVSALPVEPIEHPKFGIKQDSFLVEMRSLPGFSGSPVFVLPDPWRQMRIDPAKTKFAEWKISLEPPYSPNPILDVRDVTLLGIDWCHLDSAPRRVVDKTGKPVEDDLYFCANSGMAGVVPWWKLWELFDDPTVESARKAIEEKAQERAT